MTNASVGLLAKTGRAVAIVVTGDARTPALLERRALVLWSNEEASTQQPFHRVMELPWPRALAAAEAGVREIERLALEELRALVSDLAARGIGVTAAGVVGSLGKDPGSIGNPHIRAHAAEGQLYRRVLERAAAELGLPCATFPA